jgi:Domain of unknown function (DUF5655)/Domain of unknown function (DUF4287)
MAKKLAAAPTYDVHPSIAYGQAILRNLHEKTGQSSKEWIALAVKHGPADKKALTEWLKKVHGLGSNTAYWIAEQALGADDDTDPDVYLANAPKYVEAMYAGPKAALRPIHDRLIELGRSLGPDIKICPCQTIVPIYRNHVIAQVKPSTRTRIDFGLALGDRKATGRLIDTGGFAKKDRITHRIPISSIVEIDAEVQKWLRVAYDRDG